MIKQFPKAFTLIELLVVISIVSLLIAILIPALAGAREQARTIACQSKVRQIAIAVHAYATSNKGLLPLGTRNLTGDLACKDGYGNKVPMFLGVLVGNELPRASHSLLYCTEYQWEDGASGFNWSSFPDGTVYTGYLYRQNWVGIDVVNKSRKRIRLDDIIQPSTESLVSGVIWMKMHRKGFNVMYIDGSVMFVSVNPWPSYTYSSTAHDYFSSLR
jgi:prepilin-type N-terminal cleavage/methylation domain-containing protein